MKRAEIKKAMKLAANPTWKDTSETAKPLNEIRLLNFEHKKVAIETVAAFLRKECWYLSGEWDLTLLSECKKLLREKVTIRR